MSPNELSKNILNLFEYQFIRNLNILRLPKDKKE